MDSEFWRACRWCGRRKSQHEHDNTHDFELPRVEPRTPEQERAEVVRMVQAQAAKYLEQAAARGLAGDRQYTAELRAMGHALEGIAIEIERGAHVESK
jgi:hypothetical protein